MDSFKLKPYRLINKIQHYAWGTKNEQAFIPRLLGLEPEPNLPYAELWMGTHPNAPSEVEVEGGRKSLIEFIRAFPEEILGKQVAEHFGTQLPFLFKVLSAGEALSIQAHPNKQQAVALHARDPQHYPDDNHKPEIAIALDHLTALVGFCPQDEIAEMLEMYPEIAEFVGLDKVHAFTKGQGQERQAAFRDLFDSLMNKGAEQPQTLENALQRLEVRVRNKKVINEKEALFLELREKYRTDIGLLVIFFLNLVHLQKGEGVFLKAGLPHAYIMGNIVECMANSDNVVRAGLTPKFKDIKTLLDILDYQMGPVDVYQPAAASKEYIYRVPVPEFSIRHFNMAEGDLLHRQIKSVEICIVIRGAVTLAFGSQSLTFKQGDSILIPASLQRLAVNALTDAEVFCAFVP